MDDYSLTSGREQSPQAEPLLKLLTAALGYTATAAGPATQAQAELGVQLLANLTRVGVDARWVAAAWEGVLANRAAALREIGSWAPYLTDEHRHGLVYNCVLLASNTSAPSHQIEQAMHTIASAIGMPAADYQAARAAALRDKPPRRQPSSAQSAAARAAQPAGHVAAGAKTAEARRSGWRWVALVLALLLLVALGSGVYAADYFYDLDTYIGGYNAYAKADCVTALSYLERLQEERLLGWQLPDYADFEDESVELVNQCRTLADADRARQAGQAADAVLYYLQVEPRPVAGFLRTTARTRLQTLIQMARPEVLATVTTCNRADDLRAAGLDQAGVDSVPIFLLACGQAYDEANQQTVAFETYVAALEQFPDSSIAGAIEEVLLQSDLACDQSDTLLAHPAITARTDFMGEFYLGCGERYEADEDFENAVRVYEEFMDNFAGHRSMSKVRAGFSRSLYAYSRAKGAPEIAAPEQTGRTNRGKTVVIIQNDSPESMRISFSGPEARIEELEACTTCVTFADREPEECPNKGPSGTYTLMPGTYNVVVESVSDKEVTPWVGTWPLKDGNEYAHCFYIVTSRRPTPAGLPSLP